MGSLNRRAWHCGRRVGAKPRAPVCLSASPSCAPQGTRDREEEKEREEKQNRERYWGREKSLGAGMKNVCTANKALKQFPVCLLLHKSIWQCENITYYPTDVLFSPQSMITLTTCLSLLIIAGSANRVGGSNEDMKWVMWKSGGWLRIKKLICWCQTWPPLIRDSGYKNREV